MVSDQGATECAFRRPTLSISKGGAGPRPSPNGSQVPRPCTQQLHRLLVRPAVRLWIASCHDERDLAHAIHAGADAVVVSPVLAEDGASRIPALGWDRLAALAALSNIPVYAQGGLPPEARATALAHGAIGIACPMPAQAVAKFHSARRRSA